MMPITIYDGGGGGVDVNNNYTNDEMEYFNIEQGSKEKMLMRMMLMIISIMLRMISTMLRMISIITFMISYELNTMCYLLLY